MRVVDVKLSRIIDQAKRGNQEALAELVIRYKGHVFATPKLLYAARFHADHTVRLGKKNEAAHSRSTPMDSCVAYSFVTDWKPIYNYDKDPNGVPFSAASERDREMQWTF